MKIIYIILFIAFSSICIGQTSEKVQAENFEYSEIGINDFVVINIDGKSKEEIYNKAINWVKETYKNPDLVLKMKIENEKLRIDAVAPDLLKVRGFKSNLNYVIDVSFKDNKYRFEIVSLLYENSTDYKKIPNFKTDKKMIKNFGTTPIDIENHFNNLNQSLKDYVIGSADAEW